MFGSQFPVGISVVLERKKGKNRKQFFLSFLLGAPREGFSEVRQLIEKVSTWFLRYSVSFSPRKVHIIYLMP